MMLSLYNSIAIKWTEILFNLKLKKKKKKNIEEKKNVNSGAMDASCCKWSMNVLILNDFLFGLMVHAR